jgi:hypothetical protein
MMREYTPLICTTKQRAEKLVRETGRGRRRGEADKKAPVATPLLPRVMYQNFFNGITGSP